LSAKVSPTQTPLVADIDRSFSELLNDLDGAFFLKGLARKGRVVLFADVNYVSLSERDPSPIPLFTSIKADVEQVTGTVAAGLRVSGHPRGTVDVLAGARGWHVDAELRADKAEGEPSEIPDRASETWSFIDPIIALRGRAALTERLSVIGYGDIGGFGAGSDLTWQAMVTLNYALSKRFIFSAGYRHLSVDYDDAGQLLDEDLSGPLVGITYTF
jgi:hypothetical protein